MLKPKVKAGKKVMACSCGYQEKKTALTITDSKKKEDKKLEIIEKEEEKHLPLTDTLCQKCGHEKARYWLIQTRAGDEAETKFYKCEKCKHIWREYD